MKSQDELNDIESHIRRELNRFSQYREHDEKEATITTLIHSIKMYGLKCAEESIDRTLENVRG